MTGGHGTDDVTVFEIPAADIGATGRTCSHLPERLLKKLFRLLHVLFDICLQMSGACLPIICRVADAAGEEDEFF